jgi:hypothetical protein
MRHKETGLGRSNYKTPQNQRLSAGEIPILQRSRSEDVGFFTQELQTAATSPRAFDRDLAVEIGKRIAVRRGFCGLSKQQLGARLGIDLVELEAYEQGGKRMRCRLLLETAKQLKATPRFFFQ